MACLKQRPRATHQQTERQVMNIFTNQGPSQAKDKKSIKCEVNEHKKQDCIKKSGSQYQIVCACGRCSIILYSICMKMLI